MSKPALIINPPALFALWGILFLGAAWRVWLACQVLGGGTFIQAETAGLIFWRRLEQLLPCLALGIVLAAQGGVAAVADMGAGQSGLRWQRINTMLGFILAIGAALTAMSLLCEQVHGLEGAAVPTAVFAEIVLALLAIMLWAREFKGVLAALGGGRSGGSAGEGQARGITILDLWRFAAAQWALLMASTAIYLRLTVHAEELTGNAAILNVQFMLLAAGVMPNAMMAAGVFWWDQLLRAGATRTAAPRLRAWIAACGAINVAGLLMVRPGLLGIPGAGAAIFAVAMYLLGFPFQAWRAVGGKVVLLAWGFFVLACGAVAVERITVLAGGGGGGDHAVSSFYSAAWRHLWGNGMVTLWLLGSGAMVLALGRTARSARALALVAAALTVAGALATVAVFLLTAAQFGETQRPVLRALIFGAALEALGILLAGILLLRAMATWNKPGQA